MDPVIGIVTLLFLSLMLAVELKTGAMLIPLRFRPNWYIEKERHPLLFKLVLAAKLIIMVVVFRSSRFAEFSWHDTWSVGILASAIVFLWLPFAILILLPNRSGESIEKQQNE
jgi:hypothetical protein